MGIVVVVMLLPVLPLSPLQRLKQERTWGQFVILQRFPVWVQSTVPPDSSACEIASSPTVFVQVRLLLCEPPSMLAETDGQFHLQNVAPVHMFLVLCLTEKSQTSHLLLGQICSVDT